MALKKLILLTFTSVILTSVSGQRLTPYQGSRIFWDMNSQTTVFTSGNYARMIELQDGRLAAVAESLGGLAISFSTDTGTNWDSPRRIATPPNQVSTANPEIIQLSDGTLLVGTNLRPRSPYSEDRRFGMRAIRSTDYGVTWSELIFIYDASHNSKEGCWEPAFLELPSGEVQCYFANENEYTDSNDQNISMCRSFDKGLTWSEPVTICYRKGSRDGMPVPLLLKDKNEIVVIIEDNGWPGRRSFAATTVRSTLEDNWTKGYVDAGSPLREMIFQTIPPANVNSAAPYIRQLPWGETVASYQSNEGREIGDSYVDMFVLVGDDRAKNFKAKSAPFSMEQNRHATWNSVSIIDTGIVVAVGAIGFARGGGNEIQIIKGYPVRQAYASYGSITVDGKKTAGEKWTTPNAAQLNMGHVTKNKTSIDFLYDDRYLYLTACVTDTTPINNECENDGLRFFIDADDISGTIQRTGMYSFFFDSNGTVKFQRGEAGEWKTVSDISSILYSINFQSDFYNIEAAIPWNLLGKTTPPVEKRMAIAIEIANKKQDTLIIETIPDVDNNASWTWLEFKLIPNLK